MATEGKAGTCQFTFRLKSYILIEDSSLGGMSVTNAMENVLAEIARREGLTCIQDHIILYKDSMGVWTGVELSDLGHAVFLEEYASLAEAMAATAGA